jgi:alpha-glucosidase
MGGAAVRSSRRALTTAAGLLVVSCTCCAGLSPGEVRLVSPDGDVQLKVTLQEGRLRCAVTFRDKPVIEDSPIGMVVDGMDLSVGLQAGEPARYQVKESYPWRGVHSQAVNHCNGAKIPLRRAGGDGEYLLEARAFPDGVGFRYVVPGGAATRVPDEVTAFTIPDGSTVWYHDLRGHYEGVHDRKPVAEVRAGQWAAPPLTFKLPAGAGYAAITEAALVNYSGMALQADGKRGFRLVLAHKHPVSYPFELRYSRADIERLSRPAAVAGPITTPWRVVMIGADLNALVNCDVVHNLCPPPEEALFPKGLATQWLRPGRAVWRYLDGGGRTLADMKEMCRLAGELGFAHHVIEGFWRRWSDAELRELIACARQHGVGIWLWKHCRELRDPTARREFFRKCRDLGVAGVKIDFLDHEAKEVIDLYQLLLRGAAEHKLMVNFHGSNKPTGEPRTWPNELVREAVKGMESGRLRDRARHDATLPFTRLLAGHADYTPVHFGSRRGETTWAHQVASAAVFTAPLLTYAAHPRSILDNPCAAMIRSIPSVWDQTVVLGISEIGELAAFARRSGESWFLAILNGPAARDVNVPLSFLGQGEYRAMLVRDSQDDAAAVQTESTTLKRGDSLAIALRKGGGFIARFSRQ